MFKWYRNGRVLLSVLLALATIGTDTLFSQGQSTNRRTVIIDGREVVEGEVIVRYRSQSGRIERERAEFQADSDVSESIGVRGARRMRSRRLTTRQLLATLRANPDIELVEPNYIIRKSSAPNDASLSQLWGLINTGQVVDGHAGVPGADISAAEAWDVTTGSRANIVAIIDTGIDYTHPDLAANVFTAPRPFTVTIGTLTLTCPAGSHGFDAVHSTCTPLDEDGHGTHVAGIIGAVGNNAIGVTGVNWTANLMALKALGGDGKGTTAEAIKAIEFAIKAKAALGADGNVRVLNASWGGPSYSQALNDEIVAANNADMLFVASAGSDGQNNDVTPHYPASSSSSNVISVAAADNTGVLASFSNYGATSVDLAAPGASTYSTLPDSGYGFLNGTSMAAPHVAGAAALVLAACPAATAAQLKSVLLATVDPDASLYGKTVSGGRLNVSAAIDRCLTTLPALHATFSGSTITATVANGPGNTRDWLALYCPASNADTGYTTWFYLNGSKTAPASGLRNATVNFQAPAQPGASCNVRLFENDQMVKLLTSETVTISSDPTLTIGDVSVTEGNSGTSVATFTVTMSPVNASQTVTVNYATANGTATIADNDYVAASGALTFPPSTATRTISVTVNGDTAIEPNETFVVNLSGAVNAAIGDAQATGTIVTDDAPAGPTVTVSTPNVSPGGVISFAVSGGPANRADWVALSATSAPDSSYLQWMYLNGSTAMPASGTASASLQFTAPATTGTYNIRFYANNTSQKLATSGTITVASQPPPPPQPTLTIGDISVTEGNSGSSVATFTVTLSPVNSSQTVTVNYTTADGTATTSNNDYVATSGTLSFPPSTATRTIAVTINGDTVIEPNETFAVNLSGALNATIGDAQAIGTIATDDAPAGPTVTLSTTSVSPGGTISFSVSGGPANRGDWVALSATSAADSTYVQWMYLSGSGAMPASGTASASLQFTAPAATGTYNIRFYADNTYQKLATSGTITVSSQPPPPPQPTLTINDLSIAEGNSGTAIATFTVTLSPINSSQTVTVNYATADGTATTANNDYVAASGTLTFSPSVATQTIAVTVNGDTTIEPSETFVVNLSGATNATIGDAQGIATITTDDAPAGPTVTLSSANVAPGGTISFSVSGGPANRGDWVALSATSAPDSSYVQWMYLSGSGALPASGMAAASLQFTAPSTTGTYNIRFYADNTYQKLATSATITVASQPPSPPQPTLTIADVSISEGNSGTAIATFTVTLSPVNASQSVTVNYATADGTATVANSDYVATSGTLTFAPSTGTQTFSVIVNGDITSEPNETFVVNLSGAANATIGDAQAIATIANDDVPAGPAVTLDTLTFAPGQAIVFKVWNGPANAMDWVGLHPAGAADAGSQQQWKYLNGSNTAPSAGIANATLQFTAPTMPGTYNIRFFANNGYTKLATSATFTVQ
ncbi:MAG TPA: Calx-beta domain-containing protein [Vicinamibacterales bacterium]|nr:Calx-beta domain-containing protein [Vicinamibacterales bacterium]